MVSNNTSLPTRRPSGYQHLGNVYRFLQDMSTKSGVKFKAGELAVCYYSHGGLGLVTQDGRRIRRVWHTDVRLIKEYDYTEMKSGKHWEHVGKEAI